MVQQPQMLSIRQIAKTGIMSEHALRVLEKEGKLLCLYIGNRCLINYGRLLEQLNSLGCSDDKQNWKGGT